MRGRIVAVVLLGGCGAGEAVSGGFVAVTTTAAPVTVATAPPTTPPPTVPPTTLVPQLEVGLVLDGSEWQLDAMIRSEDAEAVPRDVRDPTLDFESGVATLDTGCNTGVVSYSTSGDQIMFGELSLTEQDCGDVAANVERSIVHVLQQTATVWFDNGVLHIARDGEQLVFFAD